MKNYLLPVLMVFMAFSGLAQTRESRGNNRSGDMEKNFVTVDKAAPVAERVKAGFDSIRETDLLAHLEFIASDSLQGRDTGLPGHQIAAEYVAAMFKLWGLKPGGDLPSGPPRNPMMGSPAMGPARTPSRSFLQKVFLKEILESDSSARVEWRQGGQYRAREFVADVDYRYSSMDSRTLRAPVVFVGYGISEKSPDFNEYRKLDVKGKIVMLLTGVPGASDPDSPFAKKEIKNRYDPPRMRFNRMMGDYKSKLAKERGAVAIILVENSPGKTGDIAGKILSEKEINDEKSVIPGRQRVLSLIQAGKERSFFPLPTVRVSRQMADQILRYSNRSVDALKREIEAGYKPRSFELPGVMFTVQSTAKTRLIASSNVLGYIEGSDPIQKSEVVVIGAHLDHLGTRGDYIFNGADDNGSGSVAVLEVAQAFALNPVKPKRSVLFALWTGEEKGLLGSRYYVDNPLFPMEKTKANINLDMVGRIWEKRRLLMMTRVMGGGVSRELLEKVDLTRLATAMFDGNSPAMRKVLEENNRYVGMSLFFLPQKEIFSGGGGSDHMPFGMKKIPWSFFMAGLSADYHQPSDSVGKISAAMMRMISRLTYLSAFDLADG